MSHQLKIAALEDSISLQINAVLFTQEPLMDLINMVQAPGS